MTDDESLYTEEIEGPPEEDDRKDPDRRRLVALLAAAAAIFIIVLVLLMLRGCGSLSSTTTTRGSSRQIVPVEGLKPVDGSVSVWLEAGADLQSTLASTRIQSSGVVDMGGGRFIVNVPAGTEAEAARMLSEVAGVCDAGRVYDDDTTVTQ